MRLRHRGAHVHLQSTPRLSFRWPRLDGSRHCCLPLGLALLTRNLAAPPGAASSAHDGGDRRSVSRWWPTVVPNQLCILLKCVTSLSAVLWAIPTNLPTPVRANLAPCGFAVAPHLRRRSQSHLHLGFIHCVLHLGVACRADPPLGIAQRPARTPRIDRTAPGSTGRTLWREACVGPRARPLCHHRWVSATASSTPRSEAQRRSQPHLVGSLAGIT